MADLVSRNLHRRHLTTSQRAMVADKMATLLVGRPVENAQNCAITQADAAERMKVGRRAG